MRLQLTYNVYITLDEDQCQKFEKKLRELAKSFDDDADINEEESEEVDEDEE